MVFPGGTPGLGAHLVHWHHSPRVELRLAEDADFARLAALRVLLERGDADAEAEASQLWHSVCALLLALTGGGGTARDEYVPGPAAQRPPPGEPGASLGSERQAHAAGPVSAGPPGSDSEDAGCDEGGSWLAARTGSATGSDIESQASPRGDVDGTGDGGNASPGGDSPGSRPTPPPLLPGTSTGLAARRSLADSRRPTRRQTYPAQCLALRLAVSGAVSRGPREVLPLDPRLCFTEAELVGQVCPRAYVCVCVCLVQPGLREGFLRR